MSKSGKYRRVPITAAERVARSYNKDQVIILAYDKSHGTTSIATYGITKEDCRQAAMGGDSIAKFLGLVPSQTDKDKAK